MASWAGGGAPSHLLIVDRAHMINSVFVLAPHYCRSAPEPKQWGWGVESHSSSIIHIRTSLGTQGRVKYTSCTSIHINDVYSSIAFPVWVELRYPLFPSMRAKFVFSGQKQKALQSQGIISWQVACFQKAEPSYRGCGTAPEGML